MNTNDNDLFFPQNNPSINRTNQFIPNNQYINNNPNNQYNLNPQNQYPNNP